MTKVPVEDLLYCDTDSIAFKGKHLHKFDLQWEMGKWKIEAEGNGTRIRNTIVRVDNKMEKSKKQSTKKLYKTLIRS